MLYQEAWNRRLDGVTERQGGVTHTQAAPMNGWSKLRKHTQLSGERRDLDGIENERHGAAWTASESAPWSEMEARRTATKEWIEPNERDGTL